MKKHVLTPVLIYSLLFLSMNSYAEEFLIRDEVHTYTDADCGFYWWYDMSSYPASMHSPFDYWNGTIQLRVEILSQPTNTPTNFSFIMWEACSGTTGELAGTHTLVGSSSPRIGTSSQILSNYYPVHGGIDLSDFGIVSKMGIDVRDEYGTAVSCPAWGYPDYPWSDRANWFPLQVRFTVVAVSAGSSFSGWGNYVSGAPVNGYSTGPSDAGACQEYWGSSGSSSSSSSSSSSGCDPEYIADSPGSSPLAIEAEDMSFNGYFIQGLMGASNGNVAGLWSPSVQNNSGSISTNFPHESGTYDVHIAYLDENDGASPFRLFIDGNQVDSWNGEEQPCQNKYTLRTLSSQSIQNGEEIRIEGENADGAYAKVDYIDFTRLSSGSLRIMPLGNSVTYDAWISDPRAEGDKISYRYSLYKLLQQAGLDFDFVGSETSGQNLLPDPDNAGFPNITALELLQLLRTGYNPVAGTQETNSYYLDNFLPEIIILHIGTNGFTTDVSAVDSLLTEIDNYKSRTGVGAKTILAQIINRNPIHPETSTYNANIETLVASRADPDIILIDLENDAGMDYSLEPAGDMHDALHPTAEGYEKMAQLIVDEILRVESILPEIPQFLTDDPSGSLSPGEAFYYNAHAAAVSKPTYSLLNAPSGMTIDTDHGLIQWPSALEGEHIIDLRAINASGQVVQTINLSVSSSLDHGYTSILPNLVTNGNRRAQALVVPESGVIQSISMYHEGGSGNALYAVYSDNSGNPGNKLGECPAFPINGSAGWQTQTLSAPVQVTAGQTIWLAWVYENSPVLHYDAGTPGRATTTEYYASGMPVNFGSSSVSNYIYSIYYTYFPGTAPETPPSAPTNLEATAMSSLVNLSWQHDQLNTEGFTIERSFEGGTFQTLTTLPSSELSYEDTNFSSPGNYAYRVAATNSYGNSGFSNEVSIQVDTGTVSSLNAGNDQVFELYVYNNLRRAQQITLPQDGSIQSISMYHGTVSGNVIFAVYSDVGDSPSTLLGVTPVTAASQSEGWQTINLQSAVPVLAGQKVWLAWVYQNSAPIFYTVGTPGRASTTDTWSGGMPVSFGSSSFSNYIYSIYATLGTNSTPVEPPATPQNLEAIHSAGAIVNISWDDISNNETGFVLERRIESGSFGIIANPAANATTYVDNVPETTASFTYRIKAVNSGGESTYSNTSTVFVPEVPASNEVGYHSIFGQVVYNGNRRAQKVIMPEDGILQDISMYHGPGSGNLIYAVYSDNSGFPGNLLGSTASVVASSSAGWQTVSLQEPVSVSGGTGIWLAWIYQNPPAIYYETGGDGRANSSGGWPDGMPAEFGASSVTNYRYSIYANYITSASDAPPAAPTGLTANYNPIGVSAEINWFDNSSNESSFVLERAVDGGLFSSLAVLGANITSYSDSDLIQDSEYEYRVYASNTYGDSDYSNTDSFLATDAPVGPITVGNDFIMDMSIYSAFRRAQPVTIPEDGILTSISMYHGGAYGNLIYGVYDDNSGLPGTLLSSTAETPAASSAGWQEATLISGLSVYAGQQLWLAWVFEYGTEVYYMSGSPGRAHAEAYYSVPLPEQFGSSSQGNYIYSIYASLVPNSGTKGAEQAIDEFEADIPAFIIYPNPASGNTFFIRPKLEMEGTEQLRIEVLDLSGSLVFREFRSAEELALPVQLQPDRIPDKMVIVRIISEKDISVHRLLLRE